MQKKFDPKTTDRKNSSSNYWIYGKHAVTEAVKNPLRKINRVLIEKNTFNSKEANFILKSEKKLKPEPVDKKEIESLLNKEALHQGICAFVEPLPSQSIEDIIEESKKRSKSLIVVLDQVTDPHNIGAILRSCAAFSVAAVVVPDRNTPPETAVLAKSASGALDIVPFVRVSNLINAIDKLKKDNFWIVGLDGDSPQTIKQASLPDNIALVLGSEGEGIRRLTAESCDFMVKIPISSNIESLNVSNAAAIALYELSCR